MTKNPIGNADPFADSDDPLVDEIRAIRRELSERFGNDPARLAAHANRVSQEWQRRQAARSGAPPAPGTSAGPEVNEVEVR